MVVLDDPAKRRRALAAIRKTGTFGSVETAVGISSKTFERYCKTNPEFASACADAKANFQIQRYVKYGAALRSAALMELQKRIDAGTVKDETLWRILTQGIDELVA